jgi:hypothetical protein
LSKKIEKIKRQKQMINDNNLTTTRLYAPHHVEEETVAHQMRRQITRFSHQMTSRAPLK